MGFVFFVVYCADCARFCTLVAQRGHSHRRSARYFDAVRLSVSVCVSKLAALSDLATFDCWYCVGIVHHVVAAEESETYVNSLYGLNSPRASMSINGASSNNTYNSNPNASSSANVGGGANVITITMANNVIDSARLNRELHLRGINLRQARWLSMSIIVGNENINPFNLLRCAALQLGRVRYWLRQCETKPSSSSTSVRVCLSTVRRR